MLQFHFQKFDRFDRKLQGEFFENLVAETVYDQRNALFQVQTAGLEVKELFFADFGGGGFVFDRGGIVFDINIGKGSRPTLFPHQHGVALGVVAGTLGGRHDLDQAPVVVFGLIGADAFGDNGGFGVLSYVNHFGSRIGLHFVVGEGDGVKSSLGVVSDQIATGVFPSDGGTGLHLGPGYEGVFAQAISPFGDKIVNPPLTVLVARIPVLHGGVTDGGVVVGHQLHHGGVELVFIPLGGGATLQIVHRGTLLRHHQRPFKLSRLFGVDAEISGKVQGAGDPFGYPGKRAVGEDRPIQGGVKVVADGNHFSQVFFDQIGVFPNRFGKRAKNHPTFCQVLLVGGSDADRIKDRVHRHSRDALLLAQGDAQAIEGGQQLGVHLVQALPTGGLLGGAVIVQVLKVNVGVAHLGPAREGHFGPLSVGLDPPVQQPGGFPFDGGNSLHDALVQSTGKLLGFNIGIKTVFVLVCGLIVHGSWLYPKAWGESQGVLMGIEGVAGEDLPGGAGSGVRVGVLSDKKAASGIVAMLTEQGIGGAEVLFDPENNHYIVTVARKEDVTRSVNIYRHCLGLPPLPASPPSPPIDIPIGKVTLGLMLLSVATWILLSFRPTPSVTDLLYISNQYGGNLPEVGRGQLWRLFTPIFLHFNFLHIVFNMMCLMQFGSLQEHFMGKRAFVGFVLVTALFSNLFQYWDSGPRYGGMSGVIFAQIGFFWCYKKCDPRFPYTLPKEVVVSAMIWFLLCLTGLFFFKMANVAHGVGLATGIILAPLWGRMWGKSPPALLPLGVASAILILTYGADYLL